MVTYSIWNFSFTQYSEIMEQIDRDVKRTHPDMHFFCGDSSFAKSNQVNLHGSCALSLNSDVRWAVWSFCDAHQESLKNVLLIFAKLNAGIRYVQGMNEILAPLFFVFRSDPDDKNAVWSKRLFYQIHSAQLTSEAFPVWFSHDYLYHAVVIRNLCRNLQKQIHSFVLLSCLVGLETTSARN